MGYKVYYGRIESLSNKRYTWSTKELIYDSDNKIINNYILEPILTMEANEAGSFECDIPKTNSCWNDLTLMLGIISVEEDDEVLWQGRIKQIDTDFELNKHIYCEGELAYLNDSWNDIDWNSMQGLNILTGIWCYYPFNYFTSYCNCAEMSGGKAIDSSLGEELIPDEYYAIELLAMNEIEASITDLSLQFDDTIYKSAWDSLKNDYLNGMLANYEGKAYVYLKYDKDSIGYTRTLYPVFTQDNGELLVGHGWIKTTNQAVEFGKNLMDINVEQGVLDNMATWVSAFGYETKGWWIFKNTSPVMSSAYDQEAMNKYGLIDKFISIDGVDSSAASLRQAAQDTLNSVKNGEYKNIEVKAVDLYDANEASDRLGFMKMTRVISEPHDVDVNLLCTKAVIPLDDPANKEFTFGVKRNKITSSLAKNQNLTDRSYNVSRTTMDYVTTT